MRESMIEQAQFLGLDRRRFLKILAAFGASSVLAQACSPTPTPTSTVTPARSATNTPAPTETPSPTVAGDENQTGAFGFRVRSKLVSPLHLCDRKHAGGRKRSSE